MEKYFRILLVFITVILSSPTWAEEDEVAAAQAIYYAIPEPFTINFLNQSNQKARYLQIKVSLKSTDADAIDGAEQNLPMIQDALLDLFSEQTYEQADSVEGRQALQKTTLETIKNILKEETDNDAIDAVYFTSFILQ
jgi:flagellar FliL protein